MFCGSSLAPCGPCPAVGAVLLDAPFLGALFSVWWDVIGSWSVRSGHLCASDRRLMSASVRGRGARNVLLIPWAVEASA